MAKEKETPKENPTVIEGMSREELKEAIGKYTEEHPEDSIGIIQFDGSKETPFWVEIIKA